MISKRSTTMCIHAMRPLGTIIPPTLGTTARAPD
jgi:hypothetical protein